MTFSSAWARRTLLLAAVAMAGTPSPRTWGQIDADEEVAFYGTYLYWGPDHTLNVVLRGRLYEAERNATLRQVTLDRVVKPALFRYLGKQPSELDPGSLDRLTDRLLPFLYDGESRVRIRVRLRGAGGETTLLLPATDSGGQFLFATAEAGATTIAQLVGTGSWLEVEAVVKSSDKRQFSVRLPVPPPMLRLLVVSDLDDTMRIAEVTHRPKLIERTFLRPYEAVPGMAGLYQQLAAAGAAFHYVSASPWQLQGVIQSFLESSGFPAGVLHCRHLSWDFWNSDPADVRAYKGATIRRLLEQFPHSSVLLVGDSGEFDPEIYTQVAQDLPERVAGIWIRIIPGTWNAARLAAASQRLGPHRVVAFEDPAGLPWATLVPRSAEVPR